jgi:serine/threonine-protein kinase
MVLPADMLVIPVRDLPEAVRAAPGGRRRLCADAHNRTPSRIVDADSAELLQQFRKPTDRAGGDPLQPRENTDPEQTLEEAFPMLERLARAHLLVRSDSRARRGGLSRCSSLGRRLRASKRCAAYRRWRTRAIRSQDGRRADGRAEDASAACRPEAARMFDREAAVLERLMAMSARRLLDNGSADGRRYLLLEWCPGADCATVAAGCGNAGLRRAAIHRHPVCGDPGCVRAASRPNVIHSDVHPRNVLVDASLQVKLIDLVWPALRESSMSSGAPRAGRFFRAGVRQIRARQEEASGSSDGRTVRVGGSVVPACDGAPLRGLLGRKT